MIPEQAKSIIDERIEREIAPLIKRIEALEVHSPNGNEEMENYRMALAYISKQSTDQQSRELAETALNAFIGERK